MNTHDEVLAPYYKAVPNDINIETSHTQQSVTVGSVVLRAITVLADNCYFTLLILHGAPFGAAALVLLLGPAQHPVHYPARVRLERRGAVAERRLRKRPFPVLQRQSHLFRMPPPLGRLVLFIGTNLAEMLDRL